MSEKEIRAEVVEVKKQEVASPVDYNKDKGEMIVPIRIQVKTIKTEKNTFKGISASLCLHCYSINGDYEGRYNRLVNVHFKKEAFKNIPPEMNVRSMDDLSTGTLYVKLKGVQPPSRYQLSYKKDKNGNIVNKDGEYEYEYPKLWIRSDIVGFEKYYADETIFTDYVSQNNVIPAEIVDHETGEVATGDVETEESVIE